ncbi:bifunctional biotin--[acetyl-CoA-carboxylase] ligase/biotin operon repressor BirA [Vibrio genomosp. F6]|uniref:bifunctional biotin--[acetyl-CoA-carboxylase] ligase/biotin operon repressor BirA n=1 Tax=Vibrio genomosp. F6 TaxID=723172 RepID=UPI0010BDA290|nr:bifunctional biotin--[acetyl-CoA-carboxylase] ligase/biotin operon repressor BirA [Vibrio genomosp. F6]TKF14850.1 bifunctional biotin--[acetyl-CoA-carboxylase] ligase/biotin operon repressor BirA [Vibrio genomosp. F6]
MKEHQVKLSILNSLADGKFYSGETLGELLGISRAAISKHINGIQEWGLDIYRVQGKGYCLSKPLNLLNRELLSEGLIQPFELVPIIDSTNQYLLNQVGSIDSGTVCLAEYQSQGRGRRGRQWISPFGSNLYLSMYWRLDAGMAAAMGLSLVIGIAAVEALEQLGFEGIKLKWPNDLYYQDKKLGGILVEMSGQAGGAAHIVLGMGLNISMRPDIDGIDQPWTSLDELAESQLVDRNILASTLIGSWTSALSEYEQFGMKGFVERWNRLDNFVGRSVRLLIGPREVTGVVKGIDDRGAVLLETDNGIEPYIGGEISLRKHEI